MEQSYSSCSKPSHSLELSGQLHALAALSSGKLLNSLLNVINQDDKHYCSEFCCNRY